MMPSPIGVLGDTESLKPFVQNIFKKNIPIKKLHSNSLLKNINIIFLASYEKELVLPDKQYLLWPNVRIPYNQLCDLLFNNPKFLFWSELLINKMSQFFSNTQVNKIRIKRKCSVSSGSIDIKSFLLQDLVFIKKSFSISFSDLRIKSFPQYYDELENVLVTTNDNNTEVSIEYEPFLEEEYLIEVQSFDLNFKYSFNKNKIQIIKKIPSNKQGLPLNLKTSKYDFYQEYKAMNFTRSQSCDHASIKEIMELLNDK